MDMLCKKFDDLVLLIIKSRTKPNIEDVICQKCKKPGHYASKCQIQTEPVKSCNHCGRYGHPEAACYKKQVDEAKARNQSQNMQEVHVLKKEVATPVEQKE